jgi:hypothetical protein
MPDPCHRKGRTSLALLYDNPSSTADPLRTADPSRAQRFSLYVLIGGFALVLLYDGFLRQKKLRVWWERHRTPRVGHEQANEQPSQAVPE